MFKCKHCKSEFRDGVQCSSCLSRYDFPCAGITEAGYRRLGDRKNNWKCGGCKNAPSKPLSPLVLSTGTESDKSPLPEDSESISEELKRLSSLVSVLPELLQDLKIIKEELKDFKAIKNEIMEIKDSLDYVHKNVDDLTKKVAVIETELQSLQKAKEEVHGLQLRVTQLEEFNRQQEQRSRLNNVEIKGVPYTNSENLFSVVEKICERVGFPIPREQINYIARIPMRNSKENKAIVVSLHNRYTKDEFVALARKCKILPSALGLRGDNIIYVNDHLTVDNKILLNKTKSLAKEKGFSFVWVKGCKILVRKNITSHIITIKSDSDLKKL